VFVGFVQIQIVDDRFSTYWL